MKINAKIVYLVVVIAIVCSGGFLILKELGKGETKLPEPITNLMDLKAKKVGLKAVDYLNKNLLQGRTATFVKASNEGSVYKAIIKIDGQDNDIYLSKDGRFLFPIVIELKPIASPNPLPKSNQPKTEKPDVKLFVMSYCPFGLQAEKAYLPVLNLLKNKANFGIYFVDYIMHEKQEIDENLRQYCIQKEENEKYADYLGCFTKSGNAQDCLDQAKIDRDKVAVCKTKTDEEFKITASYNDKNIWTSGRYPPFNIHKDLNSQYEIQGSPTIVINGQQAELNERSPEAFKNLVCQAFANPPEECSQKLSQTPASSGFGEGTGATGSGAECEQ